MSNTLLWGRKKNSKWLYPACRPASNGLVCMVPLYRYHQLTRNIYGYGYVAGSAINLIDERLGFAGRMRPINESQKLQERSFCTKNVA